MGGHVARARDDKDAFGLPQNLPVEVGPPCFIMSLSFPPECSNCLARPSISSIQRYHTRMIYKLVPIYSPSLHSRLSNGSSLSMEPDYSSCVCGRVSNWSGEPRSPLTRLLQSLVYILFIFPTSIPSVPCAATCPVPPVLDLYCLCPVVRCLWVHTCVHHCRLPVQVHRVTLNCQHSEHIMRAVSPHSIMLSHFQPFSRPILGNRFGRFEP